jgi:hypothetical protein
MNIDLEFHINYAEFYSKIIIPFGKYNGKQLGEIPLSYIDQTLSAMPNNYVSRSSSKFIDHVMMIVFNTFDCDDFRGIPNRSWRKIMDESGLYGPHGEEERE